MSLLNDALRAAEQRQRPSQRPVPYLGRRPVVRAGASPCWCFP